MSCLDLSNDFDQLVFLRGEITRLIDTLAKYYTQLQELGVDTSKADYELQKLKEQIELKLLQTLMRAIDNKCIYIHWKA